MLVSLVTLLCFAGGALVSAQETQTKAPKENGTKPPIPEPKTFTKKLQLKTATEIIKYTAIAGETYLRNAKDEATASVFSIAYIKDDATDQDRRPVAFIFNGGPGSCSVWLQYGLLGPMRIVVPSDARSAGAPPYTVEPNPLSLLRVADLVFIDPVGTGYSHAFEPAKDADYWGVDEDARSVAEFVRLFITKFHRWNSPRYVIGESYGGTRAAKLVSELQKEFVGEYVNGVALVSPALDYQTFLDGDGNLVFHVNHLPAYAAAAWYHNRLPNKSADFLKFLDEVKDFAEKDYLYALYQGDSLDAKEKERVLERLEAFTGLSKDYWRRSHLRVGLGRFAKELLRDRGLVIGTHDSRYLAPESDLTNDEAVHDPSGDGVDSVFVTAINDYLHRTLGLTYERKYEIINLDVGTVWKRPASREPVFSGSVNVVPLLSAAVDQNPDLRLFVASGYHDLITTPWGAEFAFKQSRIPPQRVTLKNYHGGHMMYVHEPTFKALAEDLKDFVLAGSKQ